MLPAPVQAMFAILKGVTPAGLSERDWQELLQFSDRTQCTLFLRAGGVEPPWFQDAAAKRRSANRLRRSRLRAEYRQLADTFMQHGVDFVLLKSFTHEADFGFDGEDRVQYDLDLLPQDVGSASRLLLELGYRPQGTRDLSAIHGRPLLRPSSWTWRGDYYDPDMPIAVELHHRLWNGEPDRLPLPEIEQAWNRRTTMEVHGLRVPCLAEVDRVAFAALHVLRHALHNNIRISHVWELACLLQHRQKDDRLWNGWQETHGERSRMLQSVAMRFAVEWFGGSVPEAVSSAWKSLPERAQTWFLNSATAPIVNLLHPNKEILWLHQALVEGRWNRVLLACERLFPLKRPEPGRGVERVLYHLRALVPTLRNRRTSSSASQTSD